MEDEVSAIVIRTKLRTSCLWAVGGGSAEKELAEPADVVAVAWAKVSIRLPEMVEDAEREDNSDKINGFRKN